MKAFQKVPVFLMFALSAAAGCGGDSDSDPDQNNGGAIDTGLPEATPLSDVSAAQYLEACEAVRSSVASRLGPDTTLRGACEIYGAALTNAPSECRTAADVCVSTAENGTNPLLNKDDVDFTTQLDCQADVSDLQGCSVTVGQYETCLNDRLVAFENLLANNNCEHAATVDPATAMAAADFGNMASPPSCAALESQCPDADPFGQIQ
jgi:hypothetical protein